MTTINQLSMINQLVAAGAGQRAQLQKMRPQELRELFQNTFPKDQALSSDQVKALGLSAGWDQTKIDAALTKADADGNNRINEDEFNNLVTEIGGDRGTSLLEAMLENPAVVRMWKLNAAEAGMIQQAAEKRIADLLAVANDTTKTPAERLQAAEQAESVVKQVKDGIRQAGLAGMRIELNDDAAAVNQALVNAKLATGDNATFQAQLKAAGGDVEKLRTLAAQLPEGDARKELLTQLTADGGANSALDKKLLAALKDDKGTGLELREAVTAAGNDPASLQLVALAYETKAASFPEGDVRIQGFTAKANLLRTLAGEGISPAVRAALTKGLDAKDDFAGVSDAQAAFAEAAKAATSEADFQALKAFAENRQAAGSKFFNASFIQRIDLVIANFAALSADPTVFTNIKNWVADRKDGLKDFTAALLAAPNQEVLNALLAVSKARGDAHAGEDFHDALTLAFADGKVNPQMFVGLNPDQRRMKLREVLDASYHTAAGLVRPPQVQ